MKMTGTQSSQGMQFSASPSSVLPQKKSAILSNKLPTHTALSQGSLTERSENARGQCRNAFATLKLENQMMGVDAIAPPPAPRPKFRERSCEIPDFQLPLSAQKFSS